MNLDVDGAQRGPFIRLTPVLGFKTSRPQPILVNARFVVAVGPAQRTLKRPDGSVEAVDCTAVHTALGDCGCFVVSEGADEVAAMIGELIAREERGF